MSRKSVSTPLIKVDQVSKCYGDFWPLKNINLEIFRGEFLALLGPNGAGKTTLINCLVGVTSLSEGEIFIDEKSIASVEDLRQARQRIGLVDQELSFDPFLTAWEVLKIYSGFYGKAFDPDYAEYLLQRLELWDKKDTRARALSGGMRRRLMMAKALIHRPDFLVLDEPTTGVDVELRQRLYQFWLELKQSGLTILLTTHYLEEAEVLADRVAILREGFLVDLAAPKDLLGSFQSLVQFQTSDGKTVQEPLISAENLQSLLARYPKAKNITIQPPKLEDVFLKLIK